MYEPNYPFLKVDKAMSEWLIGAYLLLVSCICINLYIALLTEAFTRVVEDATENTYLEEAKRLLIAQDKFRLRPKFENYVYQECSPMVSIHVYVRI